MISPSRDVRGHAVVIADHDRAALRWMRELIQAQGLRAICASSKGALLESLEGHEPAAIVLDHDLDGEQGAEVLQETLRRGRGAPVIVVSRTHSIRQAVAAMQCGAAEYLTKPLNGDDLRKAVNRVLANRVEQEFNSHRSQPSLIDGILGHTRAIGHVRQLIREVAATDATALVIGESGTGKELVARAIHAESLRRQHAFVPVNMAALPAGLVESVLFGHVKGAFTGADTEQQGCCAQADNGTLFLDEVSEMDITLQAKLLRFLQDQTFHRVGASNLQQVNVRIVAAANQDPAKLVTSGRLREDLFYRLNVFPIEIPPLRSWLDDIPVLANHFLETASRIQSKSGRQFSDGALDALCKYTWPGNVRQLENLVQRLLIRSREATIDVDALPAEILAKRPLASFVTALPNSLVAETRDHAEEPQLRAIDFIEKNAIVEALANSSGNVVSAARLLGFGQATVYRKIKRYNIRLAEHRQLVRKNGKPRPERRLA